MPRRLTNDLLLGLLLAQVLGGLLGWAWPAASAAPLYDLHRALGVAVILLLVWKQAISVASLRRRLRRQPWDRSVLWGSGAAVALLLTLGIGVAWTAVIVAEMIAVKSGLGYVLWDAYYVGRMDICIATMLSVGLLGFISDRVIQGAARLVLRWRTLEAHA